MLDALEFTGDCDALCAPAMFCGAFSFAAVEEAPAATEDGSMDEAATDGEPALSFEDVMF